MAVLLHPCIFFLHGAPLDEGEWASNLHDSHYDWELCTKATTLPSSKVLGRFWLESLQASVSVTQSTFSLSSHAGAPKLHNFIQRVIYLFIFNEKSPLDMKYQTFRGTCIYESIAADNLGRLVFLSKVYIQVISCRALFEWGRADSSQMFPVVVYPHHPLHCYPSYHVLDAVSWFVCQLFHSDPSYVSCLTCMWRSFCCTSHFTAFLSLCTWAWFVAAMSVRVTASPVTQQCYCWSLLWECLTGLMCLYCRFVFWKLKNWHDRKRWFLYKNTKESVHGQEDTVGRSRLTGKDSRCFRLSYKLGLLYIAQSLH